MKRDVTIGLTDVLSGEYKEFQEEALSNNADMLSVLYGSFAFPGFFPPVEAFGTKWFDGSAVYDIDIFSSINKCFDAGFKEEDIVVDVVFTSAANLNTVDAEKLKSVGMLFRYLEISSFYQTMDGLLRAKFSFPKATFRYAIAPSKPLPSSIYPLVSLISRLIFTLEHDSRVDQGDDCSGRVRCFGRYPVGQRHFSRAPCSLPLHEIKQ